MVGLNKNLVTEGNHKFKSKMNKGNVLNFATIEVPSRNKMVYITKNLDKNDRITTTYDINSLITLFEGKTTLKSPKTSEIITPEDIKYVSDDVFDSLNMVSSMGNAVNNVVNKLIHNINMDNKRNLKRQRERDGKIVMDETITLEEEFDDKMREIISASDNFNNNRVQIYINELDKYVRKNVVREERVIYNEFVERFKNRKDLMEILNGLKENPRSSVYIDKLRNFVPFTDNFFVEDDYLKMKEIAKRVLKSLNNNIEINDLEELSNYYLFMTHIPLNLEETMGGNDPDIIYRKVEEIYNVIQRNNVHVNRLKQHLEFLINYEVNFTNT